MKNWFLEKSIAVRAAIIVLAAAVVTGIGAGVYMIVNHASSDRAEVAEIEDNTAPVVSPVINDQEETEETDAGNDEEVTEVAVIENKETETPEFEYMSYQKTSNRLENGNFADGLNAWEVYSFVNDNIDYTADDYFSITMQETGTEDWHVQLKQTGIRLEKGKWYTISFDAKSTLGRSITCAMQRDGMIHNDDWTPYANAKAYTLTSNWKTYTYTFQMNENTDNASVFMLSLGAINGRRLTTEHTICVDNIKLTQLADNWTDALKVGDNLIGNADFSSESVLWDASVVAPGAAQVSFDGNKATFDITNVGTVDWHVQLKQGAIKLANNQGYRLTFTVSSTTARTIKIGFMDTEYVNWYGGGDVVLNGTENQEVTVDFYNSIGANNNALFMLSMGKIEGVSTPAGKITLSNFKLVKCDSVSASAGGYGGGWTNPTHNLSNGWSVYDDGSAHLGGVTETNGVTSIAINNTGSANWHVQLTKKPVSLVKDHYYTISFDAKSTKDRKIEIAIQHDGNDGSDNWTTYTPSGSAAYRQVGAEWQSYIMTFKMSNDTDSAAVLNISLGMVNGESVNGQHTVAFRNLKIEEVEAPVKVVAVGDEMLAGNGSINETDWSMQIGNAAEGTISVNNGQFVVDVTNAGTAADSVRIRQDGLKFEQGAKYHVSLTVEASAVSEMKVGFMTPTWGWIGGNQFSVGTNGTAAQVYDFDFTAEASNDDAMMVIDMGNDAGQYPLNGQPGSYKIYNISVKKTAEPGVNIVSPNAQNKGEFVINPADYGISNPVGKHIKVTAKVKSTAKIEGGIGGNSSVTNAWADGGYFLSETGAEITTSYTLEGYVDFLKVDFYELYADAEVYELTVEDVTPAQDPGNDPDPTTNVINLAVDPGNTNQYKGELTLNPADYIDNYTAGQTLKVSVSLTSTSYFGGAICGNTPWGTDAPNWMNGTKYDCGAGTSTWTQIIPEVSGDVQIAIWWSGADEIEYSNLSIEVVAPGATGGIMTKTLGDHPENANQYQGTIEFDPTQYVGDTRGKIIKVTVSLRGNTFYGGQICATTGDGYVWFQGATNDIGSGGISTWTQNIADVHGNVTIGVWWSGAQTIDYFNISVEIVGDVDNSANGAAAEDEVVIIEATEIIADPEDVLSEPEDFVVDGDTASDDDEAEDIEELSEEAEAIVEAEVIAEETDELVFVDLDA